MFRVCRSHPAVRGAARRPIPDRGDPPPAGNGVPCPVIATAAYGSYDAPIVRVFRAFRDGVLTPSPIGAALNEERSPDTEGLDRVVLAAVERHLERRLRAATVNTH